jgi:outer membrane protein
MTRVVALCLGLAGAVALAPPVVELAGQGAAGGAAAPKIGWVSSQEILRRTPGYAAAESTFAREMRTSQEELSKLQQQLDSAMQAYEQQSIALSPSARQTRQRDLQGMQQRFQERAQQLEQRARQRERELLQPIQSRVNTIIQGLRAEGNYAFIFDADAPNSGIIAADPALNLTNRVVERVRQAQ